jgi:hypothetical protein
MNNKKGSKKWILYLILGGFLIESFRFLYKLFGVPVTENIKDFVKEEKREINELKNGQESFKKYCHDSCSLVVDYFVPSGCNDFKPKILRTKSLAIILIMLVTMKIFVTGYLFLIYPNDAQMQSDMSAEILKLTNDDRVKNGLAPLVINPILNSAAQAKADDMGVKDYFAHYGPDGKKPWDWIDRNQYSYILVGENLGMNFSTANAVHTALMASPSHRKNILNAKYEDMGIAVISCVIDGQKTNVLVELFGKERTKTLAVKVDKATIAGTTAINTNKEKISAPKVLSVTTTTAPISTKVAVKTDPVKPTPNASPQATNIKSAELTEESVAAEIMPNENTEAVLTSETVNNDTNLNNEIKFVAPVPEKKIGFATNIVKTSKIIYLTVLLLMVAALLVNILVRFKIQHRTVIIQTFCVILLIAGLLTTNFHILERASDLIAII